VNRQNGNYFGGHQKQKHRPHEQDNRCVREEGIGDKPSQAGKTTKSALMAPTTSYLNSTLATLGRWAGVVVSALERMVDNKFSGYLVMLLVILIAIWVHDLRIQA